MSSESFLKMQPDLNAAAGLACVSEAKRDLTPKGRRDHRSLAFQVLYAMDCLNYESSAQQHLSLYEEYFYLKVEQDSFAIQLVNSVAANQAALKEKLEPLLENWPYQRLDTGTRLLLHMAAWELIYYQKTPFKAVIDEYVELAKAFGEADSYRFINGVLDKIVAGLAQDQTS